MPCFSACTSKTTRQNLVLSEKGKTASFQNPGAGRIHKTQFDGCVDCAGRRADFVLRDDALRAVIVELKGKNVEDAEDQVINTAKYLSAHRLMEGKPVALIVCSRVPLGVSAVQRLALALKKAGIGKLQVKSREWRGTLDSLF